MIEEMWLHVARYIDDEGVAQEVNPQSPRIKSAITSWFPTRSWPGGQKMD